MTPKRVDANHADIVRGLRKCGYLVDDTHSVGRGFPDIVITSRAKRLVAIEIKDDRGRMTIDERTWHMAHEGAPVGIAHSVEEALAIMACYDELED